MSPLIYIIVGGIILTIGDIIFKFHIEKPQNILYIAGMTTYLLGAVFLVESYKTQNIAVASTIFIIANVVTLSFVSWLYFKEPLSLIQIIGIGVAIIAIIMLELGK